jgi:hypothetical protein
MININDIDSIINKLEEDVKITDEKNKISKLKTSESQRRANQKYKERIKNENPELYKERLRKYGYKQFLKKKDDPEFRAKNREHAKRYYEKNKQQISQKRKQEYKLKKLKLKKENLNDELKFNLDKNDIDLEKSDLK